MIEEFEQLFPNDWYICRPNHNQNETPRGARLKAHVRSIGAALHTLDHQFSKSGYAKSS
jgi:hypothetical protein